MPARRPIPAELGQHFRVGDAQALGIGPSRLRGSDLKRPFRGVRARPSAAVAGDPVQFARESARLSAAVVGDPLPSPWASERLALVERLHAYAPLLRAGQFFSHTCAAALWGAPLACGSDVRISAVGSASLPRTSGVRAHRIREHMVTITECDGLPLSSPASTWAMMGGELQVTELVVLGDYFCRVWRPGYLRSDVGRPSLSEVAQLAAALRAGRRIGADRLRTALPLIRMDSWSPTETRTRLVLVQSGLPEPSLNTDVYDARGRFLATLDLCYRDYLVAIEYQGQHHGLQYSKDIERVERLRDAGWIVIQVSSVLLRNRTELATRVRQALGARGWRAAGPGAAATAPDFR